MLKTRRCYLQKKREEELKQFDENTNWLHRVETEMRLLGQNGHIPEVQTCLYRHTSEIIVGSFPDHHNKVNIAIKKSQEFFPMHIKIMLILYCTLFCAIALYPKKMFIPSFKSTLLLKNASHHLSHNLFADGKYCLEVDENAKSAKHNKTNYACIFSIIL